MDLRSNYFLIRHIIIFAQAAASAGFDLKLNFDQQFFHVNLIQKLRMIKNLRLYAGKLGKIHKLFCVFSE